MDPLNRVNANHKEAPDMTQKKLFEVGGYIAAVILIAFGAGAIWMSANGRSEVRTDVSREQIIGSADMNPTAIREEAKQAGLSAEIMNELPTCDVAGKHINSGSRAKCFAAYMRIHTFESTGGKTYSQMGRYLTKDGKDTNDAALAAKDPKTGQPVENGARNLWVTETALSNALNTSFFAEQVAMFGLVVGIALVLAGFGFGILSYMAFRWLPAQEAAATRAAIATKPQTT
jgi:hypothetical protein